MVVNGKVHTTYLHAMLSLIFLIVDIAEVELGRLRTFLRLQFPLALQTPEFTRSLAEPPAVVIVHLVQFYLVLIIL